jgi:hypothetical protein
MSTTTKEPKREDPVNWYDPRQLLRTGAEVAVTTLLGKRADSRRVSALGEEEPLFNAPASAEPELWVDFAADTGDGLMPRSRSRRRSPVRSRSVPGTASSPCPADRSSCSAAIRCIRRRVKTPTSVASWRPFIMHSPPAPMRVASDTCCHPGKSRLVRRADRVHPCVHGTRTDRTLAHPAEPQLLRAAALATFVPVWPGHTDLSGHRSRAAGVLP